MKKKLLKYTSIIVSVFIIFVIYLTTIGLETESLNNQIKNKIFQRNNNLEVELKKIRLTLDPLNFKINAKTISPKIFYKKKDLQLEYIKIQISLTSLLKKKIVSSKLELSTKPILLKDLVTLIRTATNKPELIIFERSIKSGMVVANIELNFDQNGEVKKDYEIKATLKKGKIKLLKNYNFEKINFLLNINDNIFNFKEINFTTNKSDFFSKNLKITQNKNFFSIEGDVQNTHSVLNDGLLKLLNLDLKDIKFLNTNFNSKNKFSFNIDKKFKVNDLIIESDIQINRSEYLKPIIFGSYFQNANNTIEIKDHKIKSNYKNDTLIVQGLGKIKIEEKFNEIEYKVNFKDKDLSIISKLKLSELSLKEQKYLKPFFPKLKNITNLKDHQIEIIYNNKNLLVKGSGKIRFVDEFEDINFNISKIKNKLNFETQIDLNKTLFNIDSLNFKKNNKSKSRIKILGSYNANKSINFKEISIIQKNNKIILENFLLNKINQFVEVDKIDLDYFDSQNKRNKILLTRKKKNEYQINGTLFNADKLINDLFKSKKNEDSKILENDLNLSLDLKKVLIDDEYIINNLKGKLSIKDNKIFTADIFGVFEKNNNLKFTVNTNKSGEKITTLFSSKAKPLVSRYDFIKGYEGGYLDFYSLKKQNTSKSKLKIYDFKLQKLPALTKLLTLASLQGIADVLSGEGIRFNEFEMNFTNNKNLMTIDEIYAIGPAISLLMNGYVEEDKLISLRGTLVPATTINKSIGSIPFLGKILVGDKIGEGVFGVSFKIKGPPKNLETTVNPIKTLTPRFITRTLEKIKKN